MSVGITAVWASVLILIIYALVVKGSGGGNNKKKQKFRWEEEIMLITGGSQGIGRYIVELSKVRKCKKIIILDIQSPEYKLPSNVEFIKCDISERKNIKGVKLQLTKQDIYPTILVNNAGIWNRGKRICELQDEEVTNVINVNLMGPFWVIREFLPSMLKARHGRIINVSSVLGIGGVPKMTDYCASKFGVFGMNEALRMELKKDGYDDVKTCIVCPFHVGTKLFENKVKWTHQWLMSTLSPSFVAERIITSIEDGREEIWLPSIINLMPLLRFLPTWIYDGIHDLLGSADSIISEETN